MALWQKRQGIQQTGKIANANSPSLPFIVRRAMITKAKLNWEVKTIGQMTMSFNRLAKLNNSESQDWFFGRS